MGRAKALTCAVLLLLATACGGDDSDRAETVSTPAPDPTPTATPSPEDAAEDTESDAEPADAEAALLRVEDLPTGWSTDPSDDDDDDGPDDDASLCDQDLVDEFDAVSEASASFAAGNMGPFLEHLVAILDDGQAEQALDRMLEALESCDEWTEDTDEGPTTYRPSPLSFPNFGDQTVAVRIDVENEMVSATVDMITWRRGDAVSVVIASAIFEAPDAEQLEEIVAAADERLGEVD